MSQAEARSWWADVEHLREAAERRQADADVTSFTPGRRVERSEPPVPQRSMPAPVERIDAQGRRTVQITGRPGPPALRLVETGRRRAPRGAMQRVGPRPDRIAMWAVLMGLFLCVVALSTSHP